MFLVKVLIGVTLTSFEKKGNLRQYIYNIYIYICVCVCVYTYIYIEREIQREREPSLGPKPILVELQKVPCSQILDLERVGEHSVVNCISYKLRV